MEMNKFIIFFKKYFWFILQIFIIYLFAKCVLDLYNNSDFYERSILRRRYIFGYYPIITFIVWLIWLILNRKDKMTIFNKINLYLPMIGISLLASFYNVLVITYKRGNFISLEIKGDIIIFLILFIIGIFITTRKSVKNYLSFDVLIMIMCTIIYYLFIFLNTFFMYPGSYYW